MQQTIYNYLNRLIENSKTKCTQGGGSVQVAFSQHLFLTKYQKHFVHLRKVFISATSISNFWKLWPKSDVTSKTTEFLKKLLKKLHNGSKINIEEVVMLGSVYCSGTLCQAQRFQGSNFLLLYLMFLTNMSPSTSVCPSFMPVLQLFQWYNDWHDWYNTNNQSIFKKIITPVMNICGWK